MSPKRWCGFASPLYIYNENNDTMFAYLLRWGDLPLRKNYKTQEKKLHGILSL
jgi:hypothetical protein